MTMDTYEFIVVFSRSLGDDSDVIGISNPSPQVLAHQLAKELQLAYDDTGMAGQFQVVSVLIDGTVHTISKES